MSDVHRKDVELYQGLVPALGPEVATLLMERLPAPVDDLVTRSEFRARSADVDDHFRHIDERFDQMGRELDLTLVARTAEVKGFVHEVVGGAIQQQTRSVLFGMAGIMVGTATLAAALAQVL